MADAANENWTADYNGPGYYESIEEEHGRPSTRFPLEDCDTVCGHSIDWLVKGAIPRIGVQFLAGASTAGKSFTAIDLVSCVARGEPFLGKRTLQSGAMYVAAEGANGMRRRFEGARSRTGGWNGLVHMTARAPNLTRPEDVDGLLAEANELQIRMAAQGHQLGIIVIDTLSASLAGADENNGADMGMVLRSLQRLAEELKVCVFVVAHLGKDAHRGLRGWSGLKANADGEMIIDAADETGTRVLTITKVKDGEAGQKFAFGLEVVELGVDLDGDAVTTCVIDWARPIPVQNAKRRLTPAREIILTALDRLICAGRTQPIVINDVIGVGAQPGTRGVQFKALRELAFELGLGGEAPTDEHQTKLWLDKRRKAFTNNLDGLVTTKYVRNEGHLVWPIPKPANGQP